MGYFRGVVPKYVMLYSLIKLFVVLYDLHCGTFKALPPKFALLELFKLFLIAFKIVKVDLISKKLQYKLTLMSLLIEVVLFVYEKDHIGQPRFVLEIVFGMLSCFLLVFFHPIYNKEEKEKKNK